jgi:hypothetical protein
MLSAAFGCLQDASKSRDSGALAELLARLGVTSAADLAYVDDAATLSIKALLKPVAANYFAVALHAAKNECFAYLQCFAYLLDLQDEIASLQNDVNRSQFRVQVHSLGRVRAAAVHSMMIAEMRANFDQEVQGYEKVGMRVCV